MRAVDAHCRPSPLSAWMRTPAALNEAQGGAREHGRLGGEVAVRCEDADFGEVEAAAWRAGI